MVRVSGLKKAAEPFALFNDKPLHFSSCGKGCFIGLGAIDISAAPGSLPYASEGRQTKDHAPVACVKRQV